MRGSNRLGLDDASILEAEAQGVVGALDDAGSAEQAVFGALDPDAALSSGHVEHVARTDFDALGGARAAVFDQLKMKVIAD